MTDDIKALREALAAGPTPGPWTVPERDWQRGNVSVFAPHFGRRPHGLNVAFIPASAQCDVRVNARYIATCSPDRISRLLDEVARLRTDHVDDQTFLVGWKRRAMEAEAEVRTLRKDAERYQWLRNFARDDEWQLWWKLDCQELDAAIDAARSKEQE